MDGYWPPKLVVAGPNPAWGSISCPPDAGAALRTRLCGVQLLGRGPISHPKLTWWKRRAENAGGMARNHGDAPERCARNSSGRVPALNRRGPASTAGGRTKSWPVKHRVRLARCLRAERGSTPLRVANNGREFKESRAQPFKLALEGSSPSTSANQWACATGRTPALQAGFEGSTPYRSTTQSLAGRSARQHAATMPRAVQLRRECPTMPC